MKVYDFIKDNVMNNDKIPESRKYDVYKAIKKIIHQHCKE